LEFLGDFRYELDSLSGDISYLSTKKDTEHDKRPTSDMDAKHTIKPRASALDCTRMTLTMDNERVEALAHLRQRVFAAFVVVYHEVREPSLLRERRLEARPPRQLSGFPLTLLFCSLFP
jgi:hypothetical protein